MRSAFPALLALAALGSIALSPVRAQTPPFPPDVTAPFPSVAFDGLTLVKSAGKERAARDNSFTVANISFGLESAVNIGSSSGGAGAGKASLQRIVFQRVPDANSVGLMQALATGKSFSRATLRLKGGILVTLGIVFVADYKINSSGDQPLESVTLVAGQIDVRTVDYAAKGVVVGAPFSWDFTRSTPRVDLKVEAMPG